MLKVFGDKIIWSIAILLFIASVLLVYSSGGSDSIAGHVTHLIMGLGVIFIFSRFNYRYFTNLSTLLLVFSAILLMYLIINPYDRSGVLASRWIKLGFVSFQPSELAKYSLILFLCRNLVVYKDILDSFKNCFLYILLPSLIICLLILPSNLSTTLLIVCVVFCLVFLSGYPLKSFFKYLILPLCFLGMLFFSVLCLNDSVTRDLGRVNTWKHRICQLVVEKDINTPPLSWIACPDDLDNIARGNFQIQKALSAIHRGNVIGKGAGKSIYKNILPESKSDLIYTILLEEYGLVGGCFILFLYLLFYQRILILSIKSKDNFSSLLLLGLGTIIVLQALLHMAVSVNLIPVTGQTLPLVSKGGSSVWVTSLAFGIILNISHQVNNQDKN